ncbi:hypothetical protein A6E05_17420 [Aliivibrio sp. 1S165]|uniref:hypothetical protein n=1 Tax=unclassified Aliivibrio TaxID=2645654 RepID=UPI00080ECF20|nr:MULTISPECIES: hypothetical protein [unclassified Aliivibrio]OCH16027.1 hypothetical protein A6E05_17420 [Aliivibrio sp. 1S165]OCH26932.1 hypothetical protein A6E06_09935 [Aliivibrio sp. 1S175]
MKTHIDIIKDAINLVSPSIQNLFGRTNRNQLHIVVMDPRVKPWESNFEDAILYEHTIGQPEEWIIPFDQFSRNKAKQAWRNQRANIQNQTAQTASLKEDDLLFYGSFVHGDIVVACSGVEQWFDMLVSGWVAVTFEQLCLAEYQRCKAETPTQAHRN